VAATTVLGYESFCRPGEGKISRQAEERSDELIAHVGRPEGQAKRRVLSLNPLLISYKNPYLKSN
jgi:hypothetical protein